MSGRRLWRWALWFAALCGLTQATIIQLTRLVSDRLIFAGPDVIWTAAAGAVMVFAPAAGALWVVARWLSTSRSVWLAASVFVLLFLIGPLSMVPGLHRYAAAVLGLGVAFQGGRLLGAHVERLDVAIRRTFPVLLLIIAGLAVGVDARHWLTERRARQASSSADPAAPNVLLVVLDTVRAANMGVYGYQRATTPHIDRFAEGGVVFERVLATSSWTLPSHGSLFTGRFPSAIGADWLTPLDPSIPTLAEAFARRGYLTGGFVGNLLYTPSPTGLDRGFARYRDYPRSLAAVVDSGWLSRLVVRPLIEGDEPERFVRKSAADVNEEFLEWLDAQPSRRPYFAFLNYFDAHAPYVPPEPFRGRFGDGRPLADISVRRQWPASEIQRSQDAYDETLAYLDSELARLLDLLEQRGALNNTLVVVTSDHGEQFGEHGLFDHGNALYRPTLEVPLIITFPGRAPAGLRIPGPVSLVDIAATIEDLTAAATANRLPGASLARHWRKPGAVDRPRSPLLAEVSQGINTDPWLPISQGSMQAIVSGGLHYIRRTDGHEELFDFEHDPHERDDLARRPERAADLARSRLALEVALGSPEGPSRDGRR